MSIILLDGVSYSYPNGRKALDGISLSIDEGESVAVLGSNGSGKSTLMKVLSGLVKADSGIVEVKGKSLNVSIDRSIHRHVAVAFQNPDNQFVSTVLKEDACFSLLNFGFKKADALRLGLEKLDYVGLSGYGDRDPYTLSGGQKQKAVLASILAIDPQIIIFDEAFSMLDPESRGQMLAIVEGLKNEGRTIISITHEAKSAELADRVILMKDGRVVLDGSKESVLTSSQSLYDASVLPSECVRISDELKKRGLLIDSYLEEEKLKEALCRLL